MLLSHVVHPWYLSGLRPSLRSDGPGCVRLLSACRPSQTSWCTSTDHTVCGSINRSILVCRISPRLCSPRREIFRGKCSPASGIPQSDKGTLHEPAQYRCFLFSCFCTGPERPQDHPVFNVTEYGAAGGRETLNTACDPGSDRHVRRARGGPSSSLRASSSTARSASGANVHLSLQSGAVLKGSGRLATILLTEAVGPIVHGGRRRTSRSPGPWTIDGNGDAFMDSPGRKGSTAPARRGPARRTFPRSVRRRRRRPRSPEGPPPSR